MQSGYVPQRPEVDLGRQVDSLWQRLSNELGAGFNRDHFQRLVADYNKPSRFFHGPKHLLEMTTEEMSGVAMVAGAGHDGKYSTAQSVVMGEEGVVTEQALKFSQPVIDKYVDGAGKLKPVDPKDKIGQLTMTIFGFKEGQELNPFGGKNEYLSAIDWLVQLEEITKGHKFPDTQEGNKEMMKYLAAVAVIIEATVPFKSPSRMDDLRKRLEQVNKDLVLGMSATDIDTVMVDAVKTANKDIMGFNGGIELNAVKDELHKRKLPLTQENISLVARELVTPQTVADTLNGGERLRPEEVAALNYTLKSDDTPPGDYPARKLLEARYKGAGLYQLLLKGVDGQIPNLFHQTTLSDGVKVPTDEDLMILNTIAYENNQPARLAEDAKLVAGALVAALAESCPSLKDVPLHNLVGGMEKIISPKILPGASENKKLAFKALHLRETGRHDISGRAPIAEMVLTGLDDDVIKKLAWEARMGQGEAKRGAMFPVTTITPDKADTFLQIATEVMGEDVGQLRDLMVKRLQANGNYSGADELRDLKLPPVKTR